MSAGLGKSSLIGRPGPRRSRQEEPRNAIGVLLVVGLFVVPLLIGTFSSETAAAEVALTCIATFSLTVLIGFTGEFMFAQGAIFGAAAYVSAYLSLHGVPSIVAVLAGIAGATILGTAVMIPASRLSRQQLGVLTFAMGAAGVEIFARISGYDGLGGIPAYSFAGWSAASPERQLGLVCGVLLVVFVVLELIRRSKTGRRLLLFKANPGTLASTGVSPVLVRMGAYALASALLGIGGSLYPAVTGYIGPNVFTFTLVVSLLLGAVLGGMAILEGAVFGGIIVGILPAIFTNFANAFTIAYGATIVLMLIIWPPGIMSISVRSLIEGVVGRDRRRASPSDVDSEVLAPPVQMVAVTEDGGEQLADESTRGAPLLSVTGVSKSFGGVTVLDEVAFDIYEGGVIGLIGSNGAGKSTLVNVLCGEIRPSRGAKVVFEGHTVTGYSASKRAALGLCRTFQFPFFATELDALTNVRLGIGRRRFNTEQDAPRLLMAAAGIGELGGARPGDIPPGAQKLADVCRALVRRPRLLFLDEPAAGLGPAELPQLRAVLKEATRNQTTIVMVEHNMEFLMGIAHRVIVLDSGHVIADGSPDAVGKDELVKEAYLGTTPKVHDGSGGLAG